MLVYQEVTFAVESGHMVFAMASKALALSPASFNTPNPPTTPAAWTPMASSLSFLYALRQSFQ